MSLSPQKASTTDCTQGLLNLNKIKRTIHRIIEIGYTGDMPSRVFDVVIAAAILVNLFIIFFETFDAAKPYEPILSKVEFITVLIYRGYL